jgi:hypothetical protein
MAAQKRPKNVQLGLRVLLTILLVQFVTLFRRGLVPRLLRRYQKN